MSLIIVSLYVFLQQSYKLCSIILLISYMRNEKPKGTELIRRIEVAESGPSVRGLQQLGVESQKIERWPRHMGTLGGWGEWQQNSLAIGV